MIDSRQHDVNDQSKTSFKRAVFRTHAIQRMFQRHISKDDVLRIIKSGEVIEDYPSDTPYPSRLILGWVDAGAIHVVSAFNQTGREEIVITVYEPDINQWEVDFRRRKL
jgi:hypothetical protein